MVRTRRAEGIRAEGIRDDIWKEITETEERKKGRKEERKKGRKEERKNGRKRAVNFLKSFRSSIFISVTLYTMS